MCTADNPTGRYAIVKYVSFWIVVLCLRALRLSFKDSTVEAETLLEYSRCWGEGEVYRVPIATTQLRFSVNLDVQRCQLT